MNQSPVRSWRRVALDLTILVIGILIAFALDSWWDSRNTADRAQSLVRALRGDFEQNVQRLTTAIQVEDSIIAASRQLLERSRGTPLPADSARYLMSRVFNSLRFEPAMGAYEAVVNSGGLTQIDDDSLRARLAEFAARLTTRYAEEYSNQLYFTLLRDFTGRLGFPWYPAAPGGRGTPQVMPPTWDHAALLRDPRFQEALALRAFAERDVAATYRDLLARAQAALIRLEVETR